ncbi:MAG: thioredoxin family protein, partial [Candidatus Kapaibacterium sp.]
VMACMRSIVHASALVLVLATMAISLAAQGRIATDVPVKDFRLRSTDGRMVSLADYPDAPACIIIFTCNHCPFAKLYPERLNALAARFAAAKVPLLAINSVDSLLFEDETEERMAMVAREQRWIFPYLHDARQEVARDFHADKTPHAFVLKHMRGTGVTGTDEWRIAYDGAIDDNGAEPAKVRHAYVADAVKAVLAGKRVPTRSTGSIGCAIRYRSPR